jgi:hypothetical protein
MDVCNESAMSQTGILFAVADTGAVDFSAETPLTVDFFVTGMRTAHELAKNKNPSKKREEKNDG